VTNRRKMQNSFHGLSPGFGAIVCALGCRADSAETGSPPGIRGGNAALDPAPDVKGAPPAGDQLSPACDDSPLSTARVAA
jgi:hypothetical protein